MEAALSIALRGVGLPILAALIIYAPVLLLTRRSDAALARKATDAAAALAAGLALLTGMVALMGWPSWPATETLHRIAWLGAGAAAVGALQAFLPGPRLLPLAALFAVPYYLFDDPPAFWGADAELMWRAGIIASAAVSWAALEVAAKRTHAVSFAALVAVWASGAALVVVLGHTVVFAQLLGALAAGCGAVAACRLILPSNEAASTTGLMVPAVFATMAAAAGADAFADLNTSAALAVAAAPALAVLLTFGAWRQRLPRLVGHALPALAALVVLAAATQIAEQQTPDSTAPKKLQEELDYGYEQLDPASETGSPSYDDYKPAPAE
jgi:hypothetical protein